MGYGTFNTTASAARAAVRAATGASAFTHDADARRGKAPRLHPALDVSRKPTREARDNADNPTSVPIGVLLDVTGSMGAIPGLVIKEAHKLMRMIKDRGVVPYPQILFGAIGDAYSDSVPVQLGEFEADDALAEAHLANIFLEGGGGGQNRESYDLPMYFFARHVETDAWQKRKEKGFLFLIGDEAAYSHIQPDQVRKHLGVPLSEQVAIETIAQELRRKWEVFMIRPGGTSHFHSDDIQKQWGRLLGPERVIKAEDWEEIVPQIAATISLMAGESLDTVVSAMVASGFDPKIVHAASHALMPLATLTAPAARGTVTTGATSGKTHRF